jgi:hypothetical protein
MPAGGGAGRARALWRKYEITVMRDIEMRCSRRRGATNTGEATAAADQRRNAPSKDSPNHV